MNKHNMTPQEIVHELDKFIIGQSEAKKAVAIALRNRYRRSMLPEEIQNEVTPKNIIMVGPTGVGKTEIARRLAKFVDSPFVKVEATKFTEVGYVGRDVESMVRDLIETAIRMVKEDKVQSVEKQADALALRRLLRKLQGKKDKPQGNVLGNIFGNNQVPGQQQLEGPVDTEEEKQQRQDLYSQLVAGDLDDKEIEIEVEDNGSGMQSVPGSGMEINITEMFGGIIPKKYKKRVVTVKQAREIFKQEEAAKLIDMEQVKEEAIELTEKHGIIFIDEIDKIAGRGSHGGPDVSREGVQRDILPLVEGCTVATKYGSVKTDYILFIAAGAFHISSVSDLIPELQGRFPIRVELASLTREDFLCILTQPENAIIKQYQHMLNVDNVNLIFKDEALEKIADLAFNVNEVRENIGARRLHTVLELLLEEVSFNANGEHQMIDVEINEEYVMKHLTKLVKEDNLEKYII
ncbi:MAG: ATP-dependent protease ATPase subunit HslU [Clostridia bacterium]|nr:ATP-dependent protease ATPase subunit HslU [Clostridia bacterium]